MDPTRVKMKWRLSLNVERRVGAQASLGTERSPAAGFMQRVTSNLDTAGRGPRAGARSWPWRPQPFCRFCRFSLRRTAPRRRRCARNCAAEGRLYRAGEEKVPFTGWMIEQYESGLLKSRSGIVEGLLQGVSEGWHTNGQMQVREHFKRGVLRAADQVARQRRQAVRGDGGGGQTPGHFRRWHENGKLAEEMELKRDTPDGLARSFYPSGFLKAQARVKEGQRTEHKSWKDGGRHAASAAEAAN